MQDDKIAEGQFEAYIFRNNQFEKYAQDEIEKLLIQKRIENDLEN